ncbi:ceramidase [Actinoplanes sp. M2I2]|uniref:ceramidase n=1 Tax=Actinoplanes sp. M2I2 TaxID=1734444 RepID=UPI00202210C3|nr:ceramidase [Actinoplanes sp. M2I2]
MDGYCERLGPGLLGEPLNALSNAAFLLAAVYLIVRRPRSLLPFLLGLVGLCSLAFHTFATPVTAALDTLSILVFVLTATVLLTRFGLGVRATRAWLAVPAFVAFAVVVTVLLRGALGGYLPALLTLAGFAVVLRDRRLAAAAVIFAVSLTLRTVDGPFCATVPVGTHWLWHCLNAVVLTLVALTVDSYARTRSGGS